MQGINYTLTRQRSRGQVASYHQKPSPLNHSKGAHKIDVSGLKRAEQRNLLLEGEYYGSKFTIGFEVEKNSLHRSAVKEYELFCGFERDGSCGYEAVTHILPLLPAGQWRTKVFDMMHKAEKIIDDRYSPSDKRCGGHITIAVDGMRGDELRTAIRKNAGIILALFRKRLKNSYCNSNLRMQESGEGGSTLSGSYFNGYHHKYQTALVKGNCLEFRVPSRVESVKQMMRRYELFYELTDFTVNSPNGSHESLLKRLRPIILSMYNGDSAKTEEILSLSKHFRKFILSGAIAPEVEEFIR
jgi:hypothetical protein